MDIFGKIPNRLANLGENGGDTVVGIDLASAGDDTEQLRNMLRSALYEANHARETAIRMRKERDVAIKERDMALRALYGILKPIVVEMRKEEASRGEAAMSAISTMQRQGIR